MAKIDPIEAKRRKLAQQLARKKKHIVEQEARSKATASELELIEQQRKDAGPDFMEPDDEELEEAYLESADMSDSELDEALLESADFDAFEADDGGIRIDDAFFETDDYSRLGSSGGGEEDLDDVDLDEDLDDMDIDEALSSVGAAELGLTGAGAAARGAPTGGGELSWEELRPKAASQVKVTVYRTKVMGGWLVRSGTPPGNGLVFVPDPQHEWTG